MEEQRRLLIVEDDALVAGMMSIVLGNAGFICDIAETEVAAVARYTSSVSEGASYHAVIYDLVLKDDCLAGLKAFQKIKELNPDSKAILCTGFANSPITQCFATFGFDKFLEKPFSGKDLKGAVIELVEDKF